LPPEHGGLSRVYILDVRSVVEETGDTLLVADLKFGHYRPLHSRAESEAGHTKH
jgi:hypothetical protein